MPRPRVKRAASRAQRMSGNPKRSFGSMISAITLIVLICVGLWFGYSESIAVDADTLCRTDQSPPTVQVLLIDITDKLSSGERRQILNEVERIRADVPRFGLIAVYVVGRVRSDSTDSRLTLCNPGKGTEFNSIYQNPKLAEKRWGVDFRDRLDQVLQEVVAEDESDQSLIMEAIRDISIDLLTSPALDGSEKNLAVFSDLLQHAPGRYSHYKSPLLPLNDFRSTKYFAEVSTDLRNVNVQLFYIARPRTEHLQSNSHVKFWAAYLSELGARVQSVKRIFGD